MDSGSFQVELYKDQDCTQYIAVMTGGVSVKSDSLLAGGLD